MSLSAHDKAAALQSELMDLTTQLGEAIATPASRRDNAEIRKLWGNVSGLRSRLNAQYRVMRRDERQPRSALDRRAHDEQRARQKATRDLNARLKVWNRMADLVARHLDPEPQSLLRLIPENDSDAMLTLIYRALHKLANPNAQSEEAREHGCFADISMPIQTFELLISAAYRVLLVQGRTANARFIDVGCGGGSKVLAATRYFARTDGLEYDIEYTKAAQRFTRIAAWETSQVFQADALTFQGYGAYDVVYFYRPIRDDALLEKLEKRIEKQVRPGTVIIAPYDHFLGVRKGIGLAQVDGPIFVAGMSQEEADQLRHDAERTATVPIIRPRDLGADMGFWDPLLEAASFNGS